MTATERNDSGPAPAIRWNELADAYKPFEAFTGHFAAQAAAALLPKLQARADSAAPQPVVVRVADLASGLGVAAFKLIDLLPEGGLCGGAVTLSIDASDSATAMLEKLKASLVGDHSVEALKQKKSVEFSASMADLQDLSIYGDNSLDGFLCTFGLMFPPNTESVVKEMHRILKPGATGVLTTWHYVTTVELASNVMTALKADESSGAIRMFQRILTFGIEGTVRNLFKTAGFASTQVHFSSHATEVGIDNMAAFIRANPVASPILSTVSVEALRAAIQAEAACGDQVPLRGTAMMITVTK